MIKKQKYFVVMSENQEEFYCSVNEYLFEGWVLQGGVCACVDEGSFLFMQALVYSIDNN